MSSVPAQSPQPAGEDSRWVLALLAVLGLLAVLYGLFHVVSSIDLEAAKLARSQVDDTFTTIAAMYDRGVVEDDTPVEEVAAAVLEHADLDDSTTRDGFTFTAVNGRVEVAWEVTTTFRPVNAMLLLERNPCRAVGAGGERVRCAAVPETPDWADPLLEDAEPGPRRLPIEAIEPSTQVRAALSAR